MTRAAPSTISSDITMESLDSLEHIPPKQLCAFVQHANAALGDPAETHTLDSVVLSHSSSAASATLVTNSHPKIFCKTFTAQATKYSGEDLCMSAANWIEVNKYEFAAFLPGIQEQICLNMAYPFLMGKAKTTVGQLLFNTLGELYQYLLDVFP
ncbi:hypothetical protein COEREDRAFT_8571 [Coemansia reversa NRRL 1564]|uniref:Uncharacterized protein n=1 Tax=Coemansia reversa (strain ATCC 12441 / NRRL 1564) TaxID=763665 RepID=A0A2G5BAX2_COERN|nr:hypothetical protein COEREDRAFT_8571 [Coemansia reversa NRRL 1564]|eukprot:PIA16164.1 hypothetical protein COEREDRAFT_8571 [Coemansia reversa NRRL 1564]